MAEDERIEEEERRLICMKCMAVIPSDEDEAIEHIVEAHGVSWGQYTRNIARLYFIEFEELDVTDILKFPVFNRWIGETKRSSHGKMLRG